MAGDAEIRISLDRPAYVYPMFEEALRVANGESIDDHLKRIGAALGTVQRRGGGQPERLDPQTVERRRHQPGPVRRTG